MNTNHKAKTKYVMPGANPDAMRADLERRRSNAGRPHDPRPRRARSRRDAKRAAMKDW